MKKYMIMMTLAVALLAGCMSSPSGETGRSIRNTQRFEQCTFTLNIGASSESTVATADGVLPDLRLFEASPAIFADHTGNRQGDATSVSDLLKQSGGSTASLFDTLIGSVVKAFTSGAKEEAKPPVTTPPAEDCPDCGACHDGNCG
jgi:hypothetical protein